jgi:Zn finger protein HypA/HybF involved in hydrogenase expression
VRRGRAAGMANATMSHMAPNADFSCRLCGTPVPDAELNRQLCPVCDEYAQHVALQSNKGLDRIVGELQNGPVFRAALRNGH